MSNPSVSVTTTDSDSNEIELAAVTSSDVFSDDDPYNKAIAEIFSPHSNSTTPGSILAALDALGGSLPRVCMGTLLSRVARALACTRRQIGDLEVELARQRALAQRLECYLFPAMLQYLSWHSEPYVGNQMGEPSIPLTDVCDILCEGCQQSSTVSLYDLMKIFDEQKCEEASAHATKSTLAKEAEGSARDGETSTLGGAGPELN